jgi:hypothetical protein
VITVLAGPASLALAAGLSLQQGDELGVVEVGLVIALAGELKERGEALYLGASGLLAAHRGLLLDRRFCPRKTSQARPVSRLVAVPRRFTLTADVGW